MRKFRTLWPKKSPRAPAFHAASGARHEGRHGVRHKFAHGFAECGRTLPPRFPARPRGWPCSLCWPRSDPAAAAEFREIAAKAYVYAFPLLVGHQALYANNVDKTAGACIAPMNVLHNEARVCTPEDTAVSTPNSDTPYPIVQFDLRAEPMVICLPQVDPKRYCDVQLTDMYTFNFGYMGSRTTGSAAGCTMVTGPEWSGAVPSGIRQVYSSVTNYALTILRTQLFAPADLPEVERVQAGYSVAPLSAYLTQPAPPAAPAIDWPAAGKAMFGADFPACLNFLLTFMPDSGTPDSEKALRAEFARIGIGPGQPFDAAKLAPELAQALADGIKAGMALIGAAAEGVGTGVNGWQIGAAAGDRDFFDGNGALRAARAKPGIHGNSAAEAVYPLARTDANGVALDGSQHAYTVTFPADALPPVNAFWPVTMQTVTVRTDDRYGDGSFFQGPRGWSCWNLLEYPKPIQNPNLCPDTQSTYFLSQFALPAGALLQVCALQGEGGAFVSTGEDIAGQAILPDPGSVNPFVPGNPRLTEPRNHTVAIVAGDAPQDPSLPAYFVLGRRAA